MKPSWSGGRQGKSKKPQGKNKPTFCVLSLGHVEINAIRPPLFPNLSFHRGFNFNQNLPETHITFPIGDKRHTLAQTITSRFASVTEANDRKIFAELLSGEFDIKKGPLSHATWDR